MRGRSDKTRNRLIFLYWLFAALYLCLLGRLAHLQWLKNEKLARLARQQQEGEVEIPASRGDIRDTNGVVLANSLALSSLAVNPQEVEDVAAASRRLAALLGRPESAVVKVLKGSGSFQWLARKVSDNVAGALKKEPIPGVFLVRESTPGRRFHPKGHLAAHLLGATGVDEQGLDGLEATYEKSLGGSFGTLRTFMDRDGWTIPVETQRLIKKAVPGRHLVTTLDETIQYVAERELAAAVKQHHAEGGICVVMDVKTGGVLAMAVMPDFDAARFSEVPAERRRNRALTDPYEPGSTFKVFLAASAVDSGVQPGDRFTSGGVLKVDNWDIHNADDGLSAGRSETLADILAYSFNIGTTSIAARIGKRSYARYLKAFGFGQPTGIDLIGEEPGILADVEDWADVQMATISFGQGVAVTPLQLVSAMQAIGNGGVRLKPHVVREVLHADNTLYRKTEVQELGRPISADSARKMLGILRGVCEKGTGKQARVPGYRVGGKTGTAQVSVHGRYAEDRHISSFLGVAPIDDPRVAILIKIENPTPNYWGGPVAGPAFSRVAQEAMWRLGVSPSHPEEISGRPGRQARGR